VFVQTPVSFVDHPVLLPAEKSQLALNGLYQRLIFALNGRSLEASSFISLDISILVNGGHRDLSDFPDHKLLMSDILPQRQVIRDIWLDVVRKKNPEWRVDLNKTER